MTLPGRRLAGAAILLLLAGPASAGVIRTAAYGCRQPDDATKIASLVKGRDHAAADAAAKPMVASGACIALAKNTTVDTDETRGALACARLSGDLSCYWIAASLIDEHPGQKGEGQKKGGGGGGRRH